jgi:tetratricopeptide (TPR) repeat protein
LRAERALSLLGTGPARFADRECTLGKPYRQISIRFSIVVDFMVQEVFHPRMPFLRKHGLIASLFLVAVSWHFCSAALASDFPKLRELYGPDFNLSTPGIQRLHDSGETYLIRGDYSHAIEVLQECLREAEASLESDVRQVVIVKSTLAAPYAMQGEFERAADSANSALEQGRKKIGPDHPVVAHAMNVVGWVRLQGNKPSEACSMFQESLSVAEKAYGKEHLLVAACLLWLGLGYFAQGKLEDAFGPLTRSVSITEKLAGSESVLLATALNCLALLHLERAGYEEARTIAQRGLRIREKALGLIQA